MSPSSRSGAKGERLSSADTARWHMSTPENPMVIGALLLLDERLTLEALEALVRAKLVPHPRFRQHVVESGRWFGRPRWRDDAALELGAHVRKLSGPVDAAALVELAGARMSTPLPRDRSPWTLELVDLAPTGSALLVRIHHCIADGQALVTLLAQLSESSGSSEIPDEGAPTPPPARPAPRSSSSGERAGPRRFLGELASLFRFLTLSGDEPSSLRRPVGGNKRVAWSESIPLATIKAIAHAGGHHLAEVLLAGVAGALERYERAHGPTTRQVRALLPVALPVKASDGELGNHYASVFVNLPLAITDPQARLEAIARELAALRGQSASRMAVGLTRLAGTVAPGIERRAVLRWSRRASLVVSSLAGPPVPVRIAGCRLRAPIVWAPVPASIALSLTFFGYAGTLCVGVMADAAVIERPEELVAGFRAAIDDLGRPGAGAPRGSG